jgi:zinc protease
MTFPVEGFFQPGGDMPFSPRLILPLCSFLTLALVAGDPPKPAAPAAKTTTKTKGPKATAPAALPAPVKVTSVEGITEYRLANGLRVLIFPDPSKATITVNTTFLVGSRHENYGETGMAHLLEHLVFKPSKKYSGKNGQPNPVEVLNSVGARFNGSTNWDRTNYFVTFPSSDENFRKILDLEADRMVNANIDQKDLWDKEAGKGEMTVVRNEYESGENDPFRITLQRTLATAFEWHNYGKMVIGAKSDIENVNIDHLRAFYQNYYQPDNAVLLVAGKVDEAKALAQVNEFFGRIPKLSRTLQSTYTVEPAQDGERETTVRRVGDAQVVMAMYKIPAGSDPDYPAVEVLGQVMADTPGGRLHKQLVDSKKASAVFPWIMGGREPGFALFGAQLPKDGNLDEDKQILLKALEQTTETPISQEEVDRAKQSLLKEIDLTLNQSDRLGIGLSEYIAQGDWRLFFLMRDRIRKVSAADVRTVSAKYFKRENRTLGTFVPTAKPDRAEIPTIVDVAALVKDYKGQEKLAQGEAFDASPANIEARARKAVFPSGMKGTFLTKKTRGEQVNATLTLRFGTEASLMGKDLPGQIAAQLLMRGSAKHTRQQIADEFDRLKANVSIGGDAENISARITTTRPNLAATLDLVAEILKDPVFPRDEFERLVSETITQVESQKSEPSMVAQMAMRQHLDPYPQGHVRHISSLDETIAAYKGAKLEDVQAFYKAFYGASTAELAVVGDFDDQALEAQVKSLFEGWKSPQAFQRIPARLKDVQPLDAKLETPDKANAFFLATLNKPMKDSDPDYPAMLMGNWMLGGGALKSRLADRIRQKEGLSYGVGSQFNAHPLDAAATWFSYAIYNPANLEKLEQAFREELDKALKDGFTAEEIAAAKTSWLQGQATNRAQDGALAGRLASNLFYGRDLAWQAELEIKVKALTNDQIVAALRKFLEPARLNIVKAGDWAKVSKK